MPLSAKSSVGLSRGGGGWGGKAGGTWPRDSNTKAKTLVYQDTVLPDEEMMVKSNPFWPEESQS